MKKKKYILSEEQKAKIKIYQAEYRLKNKARYKIIKAKWYQDNKEKVKANNKTWKEAHPGHTKEWYAANPGYAKEVNHKHDLGYWVVYLIHNFDGLDNIYCGQTQNIYKRMATHKSRGTLNSDKYELIKQCETLEDAKSFEAYMHEQGYHGYNNGK